MNWEQLISCKRFGMENYHQQGTHKRTYFQRDYDRLIFSPPFRRLQNKTQVFPLPGSIFVHNRLTHSLEVASVGRSLGMEIGHALSQRHNRYPYFNDFGTIVSTACLAHDMGNPPFGHSGESAINSYFKEGNGLNYKEILNPLEYNDFVNFEGNANVFRLLTHQFKGRRKGGFAMTYSTLASVVKYPHTSNSTNKHGKFGFFQSEKESYKKIAIELGIPEQGLNSGQYLRHPLVYLVEAADDICYEIMDIEDAYKLKILTEKETVDLFLDYIEESKKDHVLKIAEMLEDTSEKIAYLRSCVIGNLVDACISIFLDNEKDLLNGNFQGSLIHHLPDSLLKAYHACEEVALNKIYRSHNVVEIEMAGFKIITTLLDHTLKAIFHPKSAYSKIFLLRIPSQYEKEASTSYGKIQCALDYLSGMTDVYALDLFRKINGMSLPAI